MLSSANVWQISQSPPMFASTPRRTTSRTDHPDHATARSERNSACGSPEDPRVSLSKNDILGLQNPNHHDMDEKNKFIDEFRNPAIGNPRNLFWSLSRHSRASQKSRWPMTRGVRILFQEFNRIKILPMSDVHSGKQSGLL